MSNHPTPEDPAASKAASAPSFGEQMADLARRTEREQRLAFEEAKRRNREAREAILASKRRLPARIEMLVTYWRSEIRDRASRGQQFLEETWRDTPRIREMIDGAKTALGAEKVTVDWKPCLNGGRDGFAEIPTIEVTIRW